MFLVRTVFWLGTVIALLPPSAEGEPPPRVSLLNAAAAARILISDVGSVCHRHPGACATSGEALRLVGRKIETGTDIVAAGIAATSGAQEHLPAEVSPPVSGTLRAGDLQPGWTPPRT